MSVTAAIKAQDHAVNHSSAIKKLEHFHAKTPAQAKKLIPDFQAAVKKLDHAASVVSRAAASTAKQRAGRKDWVDGVRGLGRGFSQLVGALKDIGHSNPSAAKTAALAAQRTIIKAEELGVKGDRLLGLPTTD